MGISNNASGLRPGVCTSTTRPTAPYTGQIIFQTDDGQMLVWNGTAWASLNPTANRNIIINGDMRINQRGSSYTSVGYTLDRWYMGVTGAYTISRSTSSPPSNFQNFMRVQRTNGSSNTGVPQIVQSLETSASIPLQGKSVTVSFYARAGANYSPSGNVLNWRIYGGTGTDQNVFSYTGQAIVVDQSVVLTTSWQRFTYTVSSLTSYNEYGLFFFCTPTGTAGANDFFDITGVQMEVGTQASAFEVLPIGTQLALCQRYYYRNAATNSAITYATFGNGSTSEDNFFVTIHFPVTMRVAPTSFETSAVNTFYAEVNTGAGNPTSIAFTYRATEKCFQIVFGSSAYALADAGQLLQDNADAAYVAASAEL